MDLEDRDEFDQLATLVSGYANTTRLALLLGFQQGYTATDVTNFLEVSRPGAQKNIERLIDADLVYRPAADEAPTYALTPLGEFFAQFFDAYGPVLLTALSILHQTEANVREQLQDSPVADGMSQAEKDRLVHTRKWQKVNEQISELLGPDVQDRASRQADSTPPRSHAFEFSFSSDELADIRDEFKEENDE